MGTCQHCGERQTALQADLFGGPLVCLRCVQNARIAAMLKTLPTEPAMTWRRLSTEIRDVLRVMRERFQRTGTLSEGQYRDLEKVWRLHHE